MKEMDTPVVAPESNVRDDVFERGEKNSFVYRQGS